MPLWDLQCLRCGYQKPDILIKPSDLKRLPTCPSCGKAKLEKKLPIVNCGKKKKGSLYK